MWRPFFSRCTLFGRCSSSFSRTLSLSLSRFFFLSQQQFEIGCWVFSSTNEKKKRGVPCTHSHTSPNCALTRVLCYALKESSNMLSQSSLFWTSFFSTKRDFTKKNRKKRTQKKHTHIIPKSLSGSLPTKKRRL